MLPPPAPTLEISVDERVDEQVVLELERVVDERLAADRPG